MSNFTETTINKNTVALCTFVNEGVGKDTPIKKPKRTPTKLVRIILILSEGFLLAGLQPTTCKYNNARPNK